MRNREADIDLDAKRLDKAIGHVLGIFEKEIPSGIDPLDESAYEVALARAKLDACKALVPLLERRSKLLGLDAPEQKAGSSDATDTIAAVTRRLEAVK